MRLGKDRKVELIRKVPLFSKLTKAGLREVASLADEIDLPEGKVLTTEGDRGREFLVLLEGSADVRRGDRKINALKQGDFLGEIALISGSPRTATVTTTSETDMLVLTDRAFRRLTKEMPSIQASLVKALSERLQADAL